jgi:hypothetical protein
MTQLGFRWVLLAVLALPVFASCDQPYDTLEAEEAEIDEETEIAIADALAADPDAAAWWPGIIHWVYQHRWCHTDNDAACGCVLPDGGTCVDLPNEAVCLDANENIVMTCVRTPNGGCHCCPPDAGGIECEWVEE